MSDNVQQNLKRWNGSYKWPQDGNEWTGQAEFCGVPYEEWKQSLIAHLIDPYISQTGKVLEIACGHGRWTEHLIARAGFVIAVDLSPNCIAFCREKFKDVSNIRFFRTQGTNLPPKATGKVNTVWSYDSFVHMDRDVTAGYLQEIRRVLVPGGMALIHHANVKDVENHRQIADGGWRAAMTAGLMRELAGQAGLSVTRQFTYWDEERKIGAPRFGDCITLMAAP